MWELPKPKPYPYTIKMMERWKLQARAVLNDPGASQSLKALARTQLADANRIELELRLGA